MSPSLSSFVQLYKEIQICAKTTKVIQFDRDESCTIGYGNNAVQFISDLFLFFVPFFSYLCLFFTSPGFSVAVVEEDGGQQLHITDVKAGGLAFAKGV